MKILNLKIRIVAAFFAIAGAAHADPLKVCTTTADLGSLAHSVGGEEVDITVFAKGTEDAHFVEARPSFVKELSTADLYVQTGLELEAAWASVLLRGSRNEKVQPGAAGFVDASTVIEPRDVPTGAIDRSAGDVHARGNPHYLLDPVNGLKVARLIRDRLALSRAARKEYFHERYEQFRKQLSSSLVGEKLALLYDAEKLMILQDRGKLDEFLTQQRHDELLGGWLGKMKPLRGTRVVDDHPLWSYFAHRFGLEVVGHMEPKPGLSPTTRHLKALVETMRERDVKVVVSSPYFPQRHAAFLAENTGATVMLLAHQVQAVPEAEDYLKMIDYNIDAITRVLSR